MTNPLGYEGEPITLADGRTVRVVYGMRSIMRLEDEFGSLQKLGEAVNGPDGVRFTPALKWLAAGLLKEHDGTGAPLSNVETLADALDVLKLEDYVNAAGTAFAHAFPQASPGEGKGETAAAASPGTSGTTPSP